MLRVTTKTALAAALLTIAGSAFAQNLPSLPVSGPVPLPSVTGGTTGSGLIVSVWDTTTAASLIYYTGLTYSQVATFNGGAPAAGMVSDSGKVLDWGLIPSFTTTFGANNPNLKYSVFSIDGQGALGGNGITTTAALGLTSFGTLNNGTINPISTNATNIIGQFNGNAACGTINPCTNGPAGTGVDAEASFWADKYGNALPIDASGAVGTALGFYLIDASTNTQGDPANLIVYKNSQNLAQWMLGLDGHLVYSLLAASQGEVPLPAAVWLLLSGVAGFGAVARRRKA